VTPLEVGGLGGGGGALLLGALGVDVDVEGQG